MLVSGGKILALSEVKKDNTLAGNGTPNSPLGVSESYTTSAQDWVRNYVSAVAGDTIPYSGVGPYISIQDHKVAFNSAGFATQQWVENKHYLTDVPEGYATEQWVQDQHYLTDIPEEYATKTDVSNASAAAVNSAEGIIKTWIQHNYWTSAATSAEIAKQLADFGGFVPTASLPPTGGDPKKIYLIRETSAVGDDKYKEYIWSDNNWLCIGDTSMDLTPYAKTADVNQQFSATSAWALATFHQPSGNYVTSAEFETYKTSVERQFNDTTEWATETFQPKGEYVSASDFAELVEDVHELEENVVEEFENTSAWAERTFQPVGEYVSATDFAKLTEDVNGLSADFTDYKAEVEQKFEDTSSWANDTFQPKGNYVSAEPFNTWAEGVDDALDTINDNFQSISADLENISAGLEKKLDTEDFEAWQEGKDFTSYSAGDGIDVQNHLISLASSALDNYYKKNETSAASAISAEFAKYQLAGEYITSADADEKYIPKTWSAEKDFTPYSGGEGVKVENHIISLSAVPQNIEITSHDESVNVSSATDPQTGITTYDLTVPPPAAEVNISGENGVSAQYDEATSAWLIGLEQANSATYMGTQSTQTTLTADATPANPETLSGFGINTRIYGHDIVVTTDTVTLEKGMYHVDLQIDVTVPGTDPAYYTTTIKPTLSNSVLTHVIDGSYAHTETLDLSFIIDVATATSSSALQFELEGLPAGASYIVKNLQVCEIVTVDSVLNAQGGTYTGGDAIAIDAQNQINVKYDSASGLGLNANGQLVVKLGKGLKFDDTEGAVEGTLVLDDVTEEVVEVVKDLEVELEGKLTVNMNVSDAKNVGSPFYGGSTPCLGAALFTVPLNHKLNTDSEISFFTSQAMNQSNSFPIMVGILEYDFAYMDPDVGKRARTKWIGDTGLIWSDTPAVDGNTIGDSASNANRKYTFKLKNLTPVIEEEVTVGGVKYINKVGPELRSDRAYYLVMFSRAPQGLNYFLSDEGYATPTHSNPLLSFYCDNMNYYEYDGAVAQSMSQWSDATWQSHADDLAMSAIDFWNRGGEANSIYRPFVMIRNNV